MQNSSQESKPLPAELTLNQVVDGLPGSGGRPSHFVFGAENKVLFFLQGSPGSPIQSLWRMDLQSYEKICLFEGKDALQDRSQESLEEALLIERQRQRGQGVTAFKRFPNDNRILLTVRKNLVVVELDGQVTQLTEGRSPCLDAKIASDGASIFYCRDGELHSLEIATRTSKTLTSGEQGSTRGLADYLAQEEMARASGYFPSSADSYVAYFEVDDRHIPNFPIVHQGKDDVVIERHRFPFTGKDNPKSQLHLLSLSSGQSRALAFDSYDEETYLPRIYWANDKCLIVAVQNRAQTWLDLVKVDPESLSQERLFREDRSDSWVNLHQSFVPLNDGEDFLWLSEDSGFQHLYLVNVANGKKRQLTFGDWLVTKIVATHVDSGRVFLETTRAGAINRSLDVVSITDGHIEAVVDTPGWHTCRVSNDAETLIDAWNSATNPGHVEVRNLVSGEQKALWQADTETPQAKLQAPEISTVTHEGVELYSALYKAAVEGPAPLVVYVYGGPHAQRVQNQWSLTTDMRCHFLNQLGIHVLKLDNRGSANRGLDFETPLRHETGVVEVRDQVAGVKHFVDKGLVDPNRVGVMGWSYGGYMTLMCLLRAPEVFKAGVSGAPVTHWDGYDTHYTERYMGLMEANAEGYSKSAVLDEVQALEGDLLLIHGLIDENVHFRHSARLINALIAADKDFETLLLPDERHMPRQKSTRRYMERKISEFFRNHFG